MSPAVPGFNPSEQGLHFPNSFDPDTPALKGIPATIRLPWFRRSVAINDASKGLCGGMALTVIDYFEAKRPPPGETQPPQPNTPLFDHLVKRLIDSWDLPDGALRYWLLMNPMRPDRDRWFSPLRSRARIMVQEEWPKVRRDIEAGHLSPLGLIRAKSWSPARLSENHQVVAYGYDLAGRDLTLRLYDPNKPNDNEVAMALTLGDPAETINVTYSPAEPRTLVSCFFRVAYSPAEPP